MDELLFDRVRQLRELDDRLQMIEKKAVLYSVTTDLRQLRYDLADMIRLAEEAHAAF